MTHEEARKILDSSFVWQKMVDEECEALGMAIKALEQQPCDDCISREAAIEAANKVIERDTSGNNDVVKAMIAWSVYIKSLPSVTPKQTKWIPVSERLPESLMVKTLVSCEDVDGLPISTMVAIYDTFSKTWNCEDKVIAWMSLPEPYKEESEVSE